MNFNFLNILILCATFQGFLFSAFVLGLKKYNAKPYFYLGSLVFVISISNLYYCFRDFGIESIWKNFRILYVPWDLLILPLFFLFVNSYLKNEYKYTKYLLFPFLLRFCVQIFIVFYSLFLKETYIFSNSFLVIIKQIDQYISIVFMLFNVYIIYRVILLYEKNNNINVKKETIWLKQLLNFGVILCLFLLITEVLDDLFSVFNSSKSKYYLIWIGLSSIVYWLGYAGIYHLGIFNQVQNIRSQLLSEKKQINEKTFAGNADRFYEIDSIIKNKRLYTNTSMSLEYIARYFNLSEGYVSQLFNCHTKSNLSTYINNLRIEETKLILKDKNFSNYTMAAIGLEAGFNSKSAFYSAFKKATGFSPLEYKKTHLS